MQVKLALLQQALPDIDLAAQHLGYSLERCAGFDASHEPTPEQLERLESLSAQFSRLSDILIQRIFGLVDEIELVGSSTVLDRIYRAEKRGWAQAEQLIKIRELRNLIADEYATDAMPEIYAAVMTLSPLLLDTAHEINIYTNNLLQPKER